MLTNIPNYVDEAAPLPFYVANPFINRVTSSCSNPDSKAISSISYPAQYKISASRFLSAFSVSGITGIVRLNPHTEHEYWLRPFTVPSLLKSSALHFGQNINDLKLFQAGTKNLARAVVD